MTELGVIFLRRQCQSVHAGRDEAARARNHLVLLDRGNRFRASRSFSENSGQAHLGADGPSIALAPHAMHTQSLARILPYGSDYHQHRGARRVSQRWPLTADVELIAPLSAQGTVINVSRGGIRVVLDRFLSEGQEAVLRVRTASAKEFTESVRVVWSTVHADGCVLGFEFT